MIVIRIYILIFCLYSLLFGQDFFWKNSGIYQIQHYKINPYSFWAPDLFRQNLDGDASFKLSSEAGGVISNVEYRVLPYVRLNGDSRWKTGIRECFIAFAIGPFEWTLGRQLTQLGTGYIVTPISIITPDKSLSDPEDQLQNNDGTNLIKIDWYSENSNLSLLLFDSDGFNNIALLGYTRIGTIDMYGILYRSPRHHWEAGNAISLTIGTGLEIHADWMIKQQPPVKYSRIFSERPVDSIYQTSNLIQPENGLYPQIVGGVNWTTQKWNFIAEYYYQSWGIGYGDWKKVIKHQQYLLEHLFFSDINADLNENIKLIRQFPLGCMKHYVFSRIVFNQLQFPFSFISFTNLHDFSSIFIFQLDFMMKKDLHVYIRPIFFQGRTGSEYGENYYSHILELGLYWEK